MRTTVKTVSLKVLLLLGYLVLAGVLPVQAADGGLTYAAGPNLATARMTHAVATLADGRVALFGGHGTGFVPLKSAEIWNPASNSFTTYQMQYTHDACAIAKLNDGRYLLAGGASSSSGVGYTNTAEIFNPSNSSFTATGNMTYARTQCAAATLSGGKVLVVGNWYNTTNASYGDLYDPDLNSFTATGQLNTPRSHPLALPTADGQAVVCGGLGVYGSPYIEQVELYDPVNNSFSVLQNALLPEEPGWVTGGSVDWNNGHSLDTSKMPDGRYLIRAWKTVDTTTVYCLLTFDPVTKSFAKFTVNPALPTSGVIIGPLLLSSTRNQAYLPGIVLPYGVLPTQTRAYTVNLANGNCPAITGTTPINSYLGNMGTNLLQDGRIFITGGTSTTGYNYNFSPTNTTFFATLNNSSSILPAIFILQD